MAILSPAIRNCSLIFAGMIFHGILSLDGRPIKPTIAHHANSLNENYQISSAKIVSRKIDAPQKIAEKGGGLSPSALVRSLGGDDSAALYFDDFHPNTLGNSPEISHSLTREKDVKSKEMDGVDRHVVAASTNDFRPTEPGHSPGVGHSFKDKATAGSNS